MRIYVANLSAYNAGILKGEWFDLPVEWEEVVQEIFDEHEIDEYGNPYGDYAIHDYELPFDVHEYQSINSINEIAKILHDSLDENTLTNIQHNTCDINDVINIANNLGVEDATDRIVSIEEVINSVEADLREGNIYSVKCKLADISYGSVSYMNHDYFYLEGDGNFSATSQETVESTLNEIFDSLLLNIGM